jgi:hypothetical protein
MTQLANPDQHGNSWLGDVSSRMYRSQRRECMDAIEWASRYNPASDSDLYNPEFFNVKTVDCWYLEDQAGAVNKPQVRVQHFNTLPIARDNGTDQEVRLEGNLASWLQKRAPYEIPDPDPGLRRRTCLRLVMCDRNNMIPQTTISREAYQGVEAAFDLHAATLPAFHDNGGRFSMHESRDSNGNLKKIYIIVKAVQKVEIANCLLSLTYDVASKEINAFLCGDGIIVPRRCDAEVGQQEAQWLDAIRDAGSDMWTNPFLLPTILLQICAMRTLVRTMTYEHWLVDIENHLGVTFAGMAGDHGDRPLWPMDIKVKWATRELHSLQPQMLFMLTVSSWQKRYAEWLSKTLENLNLGIRSQLKGSPILASTIADANSSIVGMVEFFETLRGRAQSQIDLLFSVVSQRDSLLSQKANELNFEVARSTKEDSISMSTFTFITAVFLPPTFIATLFSMSMFDWMVGGGNSGGETTLSRKFWIFWVAAIPLTGLTIGGWYLWYSFADKRWQTRLETVQRSNATLPDPDSWEDLGSKTRRTKQNQAESPGRTGEKRDGRPGKQRKSGLSIRARLLSRYTKDYV